MLLNVGSILLAITLYSSSSVMLDILLITPALLIFISSPRRLRTKKPTKPGSSHAAGSSAKNLDDLDPLPVRPFVTAYRGSMMIITCLAILAVDFQVFPRRFAKVETWGTSLMDMGVGSFVFSAGIVSARPVLKNHFTGRKYSVGTQMFASVRHSLPLFILGFVRLYSVKGLDFAEHITEYGIHWNFFFTLALLPPSIALVQSMFTSFSSVTVLALALGVVYELILDFTNFKAYILVSPRTNLLSQNREGVFSFVGYLAIFLLGQATGLNILPRKPKYDETGVTAKILRKRLLLRLLMNSVLWNALLSILLSYKIGFNLQVSRRLANLPYILWVSAFNCTQLTLFCLIETFSFPGVYDAGTKVLEGKECNKATSRILHAYNRNGLAIFLLANPLTGLVNKTIDTLTMGIAGAIGILTVYAGLLTGVAMALDWWDLSIKIQAFSSLTETVSVDKNMV